jgi:hypothetical protein
VTGRVNSVIECSSVSTVTDSYAVVSNSSEVVYMACSLLRRSVLVIAHVVCMHLAAPLLLL